MLKLKASPEAWDKYNTGRLDTMSREEIGAVCEDLRGAFDATLSLYEGPMAYYLREKLLADLTVLLQWSDKGHSPTAVSP